MFIFLDSWMIGKSLIKYHCLKKKAFYSKLNIESIIDSDYNHHKRVSNDFQMKNLGEYHDLYLIVIL